MQFSPLTLPVPDVPKKQELPLPPLVHLVKSKLGAGKSCELPTPCPMNVGPVLCCPSAFWQLAGGGLVCAGAVMMAFPIGQMPVPQALATAVKKAITPEVSSGPNTNSLPSVVRALAVQFAFSVTAVEDWKLRMVVSGQTTMVAGLT